MNYDLFSVFDRPRRPRRWPDQCFMTMPNGRPTVNLSVTPASTGRRFSFAAAITIACSCIAGCVVAEPNSLTIAARLGRTDRIAQLIASGADVNAPDYSGYTPLHYAAYDDQLGSAEELLDHGAKIDVRDFEQGTPLIDAVYYRSGDVARYLVEKGADIKARDDNDWTALDYAVWNRDYATAAMLIRHGADVNARTDRAPPPLVISREYHAFAIEQLLLAHGATF